MGFEIRGDDYSPPLTIFRRRRFDRLIH